MKTEKSTLSGRNEIKLAVMVEKVTNIESSVAEIKDNITGLQESINNGFAKKTELENMDKRVSALEGQLSWAVKLVLGAVIVAVLAVIGLNK